MSTNRTIPDITDMLLDARLSMDEIKQAQIISQDVFEPTMITTSNAWDIDANPSTIPLRALWEWRIRFYPDNTTDVRLGSALKLSSTMSFLPADGFPSEEIERRETGTKDYDEWRYYLSRNAYLTRQRVKFYVQAVGSGTITIERIV